MDIPIQLTNLSQNNRTRKINIPQISKFKMMSLAYIFFPGYRAQFKAKLKSGGKLNLGYFVSKDIVKGMCNYFNDKISR